MTQRIFIAIAKNRLLVNYWRLSSFLVLVLMSLLVLVSLPVQVQVQVKQNGTSQSTVEQGVLIGAQHVIAKQGWPD